MQKKKRRHFQISEINNKICSRLNILKIKLFISSEFYENGSSVIENEIAKKRKRNKKFTISNIIMITEKF